MAGGRGARGGGIDQLPPFPNKVRTPSWVEFPQAYKWRLTYPYPHIRPVVTVCNDKDNPLLLQDQLRWFGPQDLEGGDEIEMLGTIKVETSEDVANTNSADLIIRFLFFYSTYIIRHLRLRTWGSVIFENTVCSFFILLFATLFFSFVFFPQSSLSLLTFFN